MPAHPRPPRDLFAVRSGRTVAFGLATALLALGAGCGTPLHPDGDTVIVPRSYALAAARGGHRAHVGADLPDGGTLQCQSCHAVATRGFLAPGLTRCADCHQAQAGFHHGDGGLPDGGAVTCTGCHPFVAGLPPPPDSPWECLACHESAQGRAPAIEVHASACFYCHVPHRAPFTEPTECVLCHAVGLAHGAPSEKSVADTCRDCHAPHQPAAAAAAQCLACHLDPRAQARPSARVTERALFKGHDSCGACHPPHRFALGEVKRCAACHTRLVVLARAENPQAHAACSGCHPPHDAQAEPRPCASCHREVSSTHPAKEGLAACTSCHPAHPPQPEGRLSLPCARCHDTPALAAAVVHGKDPEGQPLACAACHPPHDFAASDRGVALCRQCHPAAVAAAASVKESGHARCGECHQGLPHQPERPAKACLACHAEVAIDDPKGHASCSDCHALHSAKVKKGCVACHAVKKLPGLHAVPKHQKCAGCHSPHERMKTPQRLLCLGACHALPKKDHDPGMQTCTGCHLFHPPENPPGPTPRAP